MKDADWIDALDVLRSYRDWAGDRSAGFEIGSPWDVVYNGLCNAVNFLEDIVKGFEEAPRD